MFACVLVYMFVCLSVYVCTVADVFVDYDFLVGSVCFDWRVAKLKVDCQFTLVVW